MKTKEEIEAKRAEYQSLFEATQEEIRTAEWHGDDRLVEIEQARQSFRLGFIAALEWVHQGFGVIDL
jgi:putative heme iron utilization protein